MRFGNWDLDIASLAPPSPHDRPSAPHTFRAHPASDTAVLSYSEGEIGINREVGMWAVFRHQQAPQLVLNPHRLLCWFPAHEDSIIFSDDGTLLAVSVCVYGARPSSIFTPTCIIDLPRAAFASFDGPVRYHDGHFVEQLYRYETDRYISFEGRTLDVDQLPWHSFNEIDNFGPSYLAAKGH